MPRRPRLDAPGVLQHVIARGIERRLIFRDDRAVGIRPAGVYRVLERGRQQAKHWQQVWSGNYKVKKVATSPYSKETLSESLSVL